MLEGTAKALLNLLQRIDQEPDLTYESLVTTQRQAVKDEQDKLDELLKLEGLCDATTLKTPSGRKRRRDRGKKRLTAKQEQQIETALDAVNVGDTARTPSAENGDVFEMDSVATQQA